MTRASNSAEQVAGRRQRRRSTTSSTISGDCLAKPVQLIAMPSDWPDPVADPVRTLTPKHTIAAQVRSCRAPDAQERRHFLRIGTDYLVSDTIRLKRYRSTPISSDWPTVFAERPGSTFRRASNRKLWVFLSGKAVKKPRSPTHIAPYAMREMHTQSLRSRWRVEFKRGIDICTVPLCDQLSFKRWLGSLHGMSSRAPGLPVR